jgi:hypothetical protein
MYVHDAFAAHHFAKLCGGWYDKETNRSLRHIFVGVKRRRLFKARRQPEALSAAYLFGTARDEAGRVERPPSSSSFYARGRMKREMRFFQEAAAASPPRYSCTVHLGEANLREVLQLCRYYTDCRSDFKRLACAVAGEFPSSSGKAASP